IVPPTCSRPAPENTIALGAPLLVLVMFPETVAVPVLMPSWAIRLLLLLVLRARLPALSVPAPTLSWVVVVEAELAVTVTEVAFRVAPELITTLLAGGVE